MGLGESTSHIVFFVAAVTIASVSTAAFYPAAREMAAARVEADERVVDRLETLLTVTAVSHDAVTGTLTLLARNDGGTVVPFESITVVADGIPATSTSGAVDGAPGSALFAPGDTATLTISGVTTVPDRVLLVTDAGAGHLLQLGDTAAAQAGVGMYVGAGGNNSRYFHAMDVGAQGTSASGVFKTKNAADTTVADVLRLFNRGDAPVTVTLTGNEVPASAVELFRWTVKNGTTTIATIDHRTASPSASFSMPAGYTYTLTLRLDLAEGSGQHNAQFDFGLLLGV